MIDLLALKKTVETEMASALDLSGLSCEFSEAFASKTPEHRAVIREALSRSISTNVAVEEASSLSNLLLPPRLKDVAISISHCPSLGGFVHSPKNGFFDIGFDIEIANRVSVPVAKKVLPHPVESFLLDIIERNEKSLPAFVWAAKESAIKSMGNTFPERQIFYGNLALTAFVPSTDSSVFHFRAALTEVRKSHGLEVRGIVRKTDQWILGLAITYSLPTKLEQ